MRTFSRPTSFSTPIIAFALLVLLPLVASAVDFTGTWSGTSVAVAQCGGNPVVSEGAATLNLLQIETRIVGTGVIDLVEFGCTDDGQASFAFTFSIAGTVYGEAFSATATAPGLGQGYISAAIAEGALNFVLVGGDTTFVGTLTQTSSSPPASTMTGAYSGTYQSVEDVSEQCANMTTLSYSGSLTGNLLQLGDALSGPFVADGVKVVRPDQSHHCTIESKTGGEAIYFSGTISGNTISGFAGAMDDDLSPFTATISGNTISGSSDSGGDHTTFTLTRTSSVPAPLILGFAAKPANIQPGKSAVLSWATTNAAGVLLDQGIGPRPASGSLRVSPFATTTYTLTAKGPGGTATSQATVTVTATPAFVVLSAHPEGMLQRAGESGATDAYTLTNVGGAPTTITLSQTGDFFTQAPASFALEAGASQTVTITAAARPAGVYEGSSRVAGQGVKPDAAIRVILLSAGSPAGRVDPRPETRRREVSAPAGTDPTGSISFTNRGEAALEAIAVSDVEWLAPLVGRVTIPPGASASVPFAIRRGLRPDASAPVGAAKARFGLLFFGGPFASSGKTAQTTVLVSKSLVTVVDTVKPTTSATPPPPLADGELALFVAGMSSLPGETGDLLIASRSEDAVGDLRIYYSGSGSTPSFLQGSVASLVANAGIEFPGVVRNVFGKEGQSGTVQLRSAALREIAVSATKAGTSPDATAVATALPVFRSDRGADAGEEIVLAGVDQASASVALLVQEMAGAPATVQIDAFASSGQVVGTTRTEAVGGFALLELTNAVPAGAATLRIRNVSAGGGRIAAAAMARDAGSGDVWAITDPVAGPALDERFYVPLLGGLQKVAGAETDLLFVNGGPAPVEVTLERNTTYPRRRPIGIRGAGGSSAVAPSAGAETLAAAPYQLVMTSSADSRAGVAVIDTGSAVRTVGRIEFAPAGGSGRVGSSLPAMPASSALRYPDGRRFPGIEDASDATAAARTPLTYSSDLLLVETQGAEAGVRVTIHFTYAVSSALSSEIVAATDVAVAPHGIHIMRDIVSAVMGAQRSRYGDLTNVMLDVEVISGEGAVIPFVQTIDSASHDVVVRTE